MVLIGLLMAISLGTEISRKKLYNVINFPFTLLGLGLSLVDHRLEFHLIGGLVMFGLTVASDKTFGYYGGHIKLMTALGTIGGLQFILPAWVAGMSVSLIVRFLVALHDRHYYFRGSKDGGRHMATSVFVVGWF
jgi:hypothetical protein